MALADRVLELERQLSRLERENAILKEQRDDMESDIRSIQQTQIVNQQETHKLQLEIAKGQGGIKTILILGGALLGLINILTFAVNLLKGH